MKKILIIFFYSSFFIGNCFSADFLQDVKQLKWGDLEVVWLKDLKFPRFSAVFYFQDGAINDSIPGLTNTTLEQLTSGTENEVMKEISDFFEFYGAKIKTSVTHEYATLSVQGLTKDINPVMNKVCHLFKHASFPDKELNSYVSRSQSQLKNILTSHSALAERVFRKVSLAGTPFAEPAEGNLESLGKLKSILLKERLSQINQAKKVLYLSGPEEALKMEQIILEKCPWVSERSISKIQVPPTSEQKEIIFIPVPGANQAQIRIGRYLTPEEFKASYDQLTFLAGFLGGGFTSKLVQELRVKRGLTYSAGAYASMQREFGRVGISTFSRNETTDEAIQLIKQILADVGEGKFSDKDFLHQQGHLVGGFAFGFEESSSFLFQLMLYSHQGRGFQDLISFPTNISSMGPQNLADISRKTLDWNKLNIVVVGDKSLVQKLSKIRKVKVVEYDKFL
jgi:zinc protease